MFLLKTKQTIFIIIKNTIYIILKKLTDNAYEK